MCCTVNIDSDALHAALINAAISGKPLPPLSTGNRITPSPTRIPNEQQAEGGVGGWNEPVQTWHGEHAGGDGGADGRRLLFYS